MRRLLSPSLAPLLGLVLALLAPSPLLAVLFSLALLATLFSLPLLFSSTLLPVLTLSAVLTFLAVLSLPALLTGSAALTLLAALVTTPFCPSRLPWLGFALPLRFPVALVAPEAALEPASTAAVLAALEAVPLLVSPFAAVALMSVVHRYHS